MIIDYRTTRYCPSYINLAQEKNNVCNEIRRDHPRAIDMHRYIRRNDERYKTLFMSAYNSKCAYCGVSLDIISRETFEVDHFIYESSFPTKAEAGYIENLVLSCYNCNRKKKSFLISEKLRRMLHPDSDSIKSIFIRNEDYYIEPFMRPRVHYVGLKKTEIFNFFTQLNLGGELRRIDYLLMNMIGLRKTMQDKPEIYKMLGEAIDKMKEGRNTNLIHCR